MNTSPLNALYPAEGKYGFPLTLKARYDNFIGGDWVAPVAGEYYPNLTPVTGQLLCEVASSGPQDIDLALDAAHKARAAWGRCPSRGASGNIAKNRRSHGAKP